jgi:hypothetical protein
MSFADAPGTPGFAELRALSWRISIHALEYSLTISPLAEVHRGVFSIILVGNQIAEYLPSQCAASGCWYPRRSSCSVGLSAGALGVINKRRGLCS